MNCIFVQHPHEFKTNSAHFFRNIISNRGITVNRISRDDFQLNFVNSKDFLVLFQSDEFIPYLNTFKGEAVIVPMLDEALNKPISFFQLNRRHKYISFSKYLHLFLLFGGCNSTYLQFWPERLNIERYHNKSVLNIFFWERTPSQVSWLDVENWFSNYNCNIHLRQHWDPDFAGVKLNHRKEKIVPLPSNWSRRDSYLKFLSRMDIFVAPRRWEGIGMSSLEALTMGIPVVGLSSPTLSEYVQNRKNGYLFKRKDSILPQLDFCEMGVNSALIAELGRSNFENKSLQLFDSILEKKSKVIYSKKSFLPGSMTLRQFIFLYGGYV